MHSDHAQTNNDNNEIDNNDNQADVDFFRRDSAALFAVQMGDGLRELERSFDLQHGWILRLPRHVARCE